ncbi:MAG TPA: Crp/Fnr family transcriptional regulator [Steroidobacteraceae bacterium]|nr:Crp/Fnr family transcriptional regulator [Steroidobacteraceae bacterium]
MRRWLPGLERIEMSMGCVLFEPHEVATHVYFPATATVSLLYVLETGASVEVAMVGSEGVIGMSVLLGGLTSGRARVRSNGTGFRMRAEHLAAEIERSPVVMRLMMRHVLALLIQTGQTAACMRHHSVEQQLCRWLLQSLDRAPGSDISMTQQDIADTLGIRRERVTQAALSLQEAGLIRYLRGHITVLDRGSLEQRACECYAMLKQEYRRLLPRRARPAAVSSGA